MKVISRLNGKSDEIFHLRFISRISFSWAPDKNPHNAKTSYLTWAKHFSQWLKFDAVSGRKVLPGVGNTHLHQIIILPFF
jgi:hypothetical protein